MIRVILFDDHPAMRAGLRAVLDAEPGIVFAGEADTEEALWPLLRRASPDLVLLDYHFARGDGMQLCYRIKRAFLAPKVVIYSAYASPRLAIPAHLARADGLISKGVPALELLGAIRRVNRGERLLDPISNGAWRNAVSEVPQADQPVVAMLLQGSTDHDVADALRMPLEDVRHVVQRTVSRLALDIPATPL